MAIETIGGRRRANTLSNASPRSSSAAGSCHHQPSCGSSDQIPTTASTAISSTST
jgi:hypothetical protein